MCNVYSAYLYIGTISSLDIVYWIDFLSRFAPQDSIKIVMRIASSSIIIRNAPKNLSLGAAAARACLPYKRPYYDHITFI